MAQRLAQIEGERTVLIAALKDAAGNTTFSVEGGSVGWHFAPKQEAKPDAAFQMFGAWKEAGGDMNGFLAALKPGMSSLQAIASKLHKDKTERERRISAWSQSKAAREFGVRVTPKEEP